MPKLPNLDKIILNYSLNLEMLAKRIRKVDKAYKKLEELQNTPRETFFTENSTEQYATRAALHMALQALLDIVGHILTRIPGAKHESYRQNVEQLGKKGILSEDFLPTAIQMAGYRGRLVHYYIDIDSKELYDILQNKLEDITKFKHQLVKFINEHKNDTEFLMQR
ncbi:hypothetical protein B5M47_03615 [candidate division CPR3 bacterium 4484_211]|uniref:DUF86 domain-containing protein n=1 Tax=candidate division CPR3 bacterium 4484_211 TaxID=1968527 RepID=A0A1W9NX35_UNCC3|nr:MAG: hypothetical protein B5M47_03615 [candidate division CPR3 bacterium 4484_211]